MKGFRWHLNVGSSLVSIILSSIEPTLGAILGESFHTTTLDNWVVEELFLLFYYHGRLEASLWAPDVHCIGL